MNFHILASGSKGNSALISTGQTKLLIDQGLSVKELTARLNSVGESIDRLDAVILSHEHTDHVDGIPLLMKALLRRGKVLPVYLTRLTNEVVDWGEIEEPPVCFFEAGKAVEIGDLRVQTFSIPHDAVDPVAFTVESRDGKIGMANDLGFVPDALRWRFRDCQTVYIESNHDEAMLAAGDYPEPLKARILGNWGHLSNGQVAEFLRKDLPKECRSLILGHLSAQNNHPENVRSSVLDGLKGRTVDFVIARQDAVVSVSEIEMER